MQELTTGRTPGLTQAEDQELMEVERGASIPSISVTPMEHNLGVTNLKSPATRDQVAHLIENHSSITDRTGGILMSGLRSGDLLTMGKMAEMNVSTAGGS